METTRPKKNQLDNTISKLCDEKRLARDIGKMIKETRIVHSLSQSELAMLVDTKQASISRLEQGYSLPSIRFLLKIAIAVNSFLIPPIIASVKDPVSYEKYMIKSANDVSVSTSSSNIIFTNFFEQKATKLSATYSL